MNHLRSSRRFLGQMLPDGALFGQLPGLHGAHQELRPGLLAQCPNKKLVNVRFPVPHAHQGGLGTALLHRRHSFKTLEPLVTFFLFDR